MSETISSGLTITIPSEGDENWAESIRDNCFAIISAHDHTGGGDGVQIATAAIVDGAVTEAKLDTDAATRSCLLIESAVSVNDGSSSIGEMTRLGGSSTKETRMPKAGKVTHITINCQTGKTAGTLTITLYKNGVTTGKTVTLGNSEHGGASITAETFAAGDRISLAITTSSVTFTSPPANLIATAWGHFTE